jgi:major vault protein
MTERQRERELVLAPNEFAYVLDTTKGHINCYVGPNKTSLAQTDQPVAFNPKTKRFEHVDLHRATKLFPTAPANWYMILKNPARSGERPSPGVSNAMAELTIGEKVVLRGPVSFPLWPGQMARVIQGHRLESNQYLHVRIYDYERAREGWNGALGRGPDAEVPEFEVGDTLVIRGTDVAFFIPPDGAEVVPDEHGQHVRNAVTLNALEYCVLERDDGTRRFVRGEAVVFPESSESFLVRDGRRKFRAVELSGTTGIHVKVVAPYEDEEGLHQEGEELFITGENTIYFPRAEHVVVRYGDHDYEIHHAVAIPRGEGRYVLKRETGEVDVVLGPRMFLPDPRHEVIVRRVLTDSECGLIYPGNTEVREFNRRLRDHESVERPAAPDATPRRARVAEEPDVIEREWVPPRVLTLDGRYEGVVTVELWPGYAVQVVDRANRRRVETGPKTLLLAYDETLAPLTLSTGTPKSDRNPLRTAFLQITGNKVTDAFEVTSSDMVECLITVSYRVDFDGDDPDRWFEVDNYVKLLCDHGRSIIANAARSMPIRALFTEVTSLVRDAVLGKADGPETRPGRRFDENAMRVYDVEVLEFGVLDDEVEKILVRAQRDAIRTAIEVSRAVTEVAEHRRLRELERDRASADHETRKLQLQLEEQEAGLEWELRQKRHDLEHALAKKKRAAELEAAREMTEVIAQSIEGRQVEHEAEVTRQTDLLELRLRELAARVDATTSHAEAFSPHLVEALRRLGDEELLGKLSDNFSELAAIEGRGLLETAQKFLDFVPAGYMPHLRGDAE